MNNIAQIDTVNISNVVSLTGFKNDKHNAREESTLQSYYQLLGFNELINEAQAVILELDNRDLSVDLAMKSKAILAEFTKRSHGLNPLLSKAISDISKNIQSNIKLLNL